MNYELIIKEPENENDFSDYFYFRWTYLRKPLGGTLNSAKDENEDKSYHIMVIQDSEIVGVGRLHRVENYLFQIRFMAVSPNKREKGVGTIIIQKLESIARKNDANKIILHARVKAISFYKKNGYKIIKKTHKIMNKIQHYLMEKKIN